MPLVLVIDDEDSILENLQFNLELYGFDIIKAHNGIEGIDLFKEHVSAIDAVITDMKMPGVSGLNVIKQILSIDADIGIIVLTGHGDTDNAVAAMSEGAFYYFQKPFQVEKLVFSLEKAIQKKDIMVENKKLHEDLIIKNRYLQNLHDSAQRTLMNFLPLDLAEFQLIDTSCVYRSCDKVGGDMYDIFETEDYIFFYIFDVCSHGILAAVNAIMIKAYFFRMKYYGPDTDIEKSLAADFKDLNLELCRNTSSVVFATLFTGCIDKRTKRMYYASAGHIDQYLIHDNTLITLSSTGTILGTFEDVAYDVKQYQLYADDMLLLFTDGVTDSWEKGSVMGQEAIRNLIYQKREGPVESVVKAIDDKIIKLTAEVSDDDLTILGLQIKDGKAVLK